MPANKADEVEALSGRSQERHSAVRKGGREAEKLWRALACIFMFVAIAVAVAFAIFAASIPAASEAEVEHPRPCGDGKKRASSISMPPYRSNDIFRGLEEDEYMAVKNFLLRRKDLNLTASPSATINSNYIFLIEDYLPSKNDVMDYLANRRSGNALRRAKVVVYFGATNPKTVKEFLVSPIPNPTRVEEFSYGQGKSISWKSRPLDDVVESPALISFLKSELSKITDLLRRSFGQWLDDDCAKTCLFPIPIPRSVPDSDDRYFYIGFYLDAASVEGNYLYPVALQLIIRYPNQSDSLAVEYVYYNHERFDSIDALLRASASMPLLKPLDTSQLKGRHSSPRKRGKNVNPENLKPPMQYQPQSPRFALNQRHVEYLGWSFDLYFRTTSGLSLFNVQYNRQSIAYEIGMQDVLVMYGGVEPFNYFQTFFDNGFSLGSRNLPLVREVDCPSDAVYLDNFVYSLGVDKPRKMKDAACIFEHKNSIPLRRHYSENFYDGTYNFAFSLPDSVLVVRQILTLWNYDYIFDYEFHQNGVIETKVSSTGYIIVTSSLDRRYGYLISDKVHTLANVHSHMFNFKYDLDVGGRKNRLTSINIETEDTSIPLLSKTFKQMTVSEKTAKSELDSLVKYDFSKPRYYTIQNDDHKNSAGHPIGYRIHSAHFAHPLLPDSNPQMNGASWTKHQLAVTRYKDNERGTASVYTQGDPTHPVVDFQDFYRDDESIVDEDLVAWATVGIHHIPSLEDVPVTTTPGRTLSVALVPFNFFDEDPSMNSADAVVLLKDEEGKISLVTYLNKSQPCIVAEGNVTLNV